MKKFLIIVVMIIAIAVVFSKTRGHKQVSNCELYAMDDRVVNIANYKGTPVILLFWASWCPYCRESLPVANSAYPDMKDSGIQLFGVNIQESKELVAQYIIAHPVDFDMLLDKDGACAQSYGIRGIPAYILINKEGKVVAQQNSMPNNYKDLLLK